MSEWAAYVTVFVAAAIPWLEVLLVVPAGIVAGLPPVPTALVGAIGNVATLVPLVVAGDRLRAWWRGRRSETSDRSETPTGRQVRARRLFDRYGLPGLAALGPLLTGVHVAALVGLAAGAAKRPTVIWLSIGVVVWAGLAAGATVLGIDALVDPDALPDLLTTAARGHR